VSPSLTLSGLELRSLFSTAWQINDNRSLDERQFFVPVGVRQ
tara:strand:+ start:620 stop:745 length:126 start_codon:yes stop_codon:yes gene_type:complete